MIQQQKAVEKIILLFKEVRDIRFFSRLPTENPVDRRSRIGAVLAPSAEKR